MRDNIPDALITAFERQYDSSWNDPQLRNERLAMRYGWAAAMEAKPCLHQIQEPAPATAMDALREAEAALEVAMARILKADPGHSIRVTSEAKALVAVRAALAAPAAVAVPDERVAFQDGAWYWVEREVWGNEPLRIAPAMYKENCDAWYSYEFGGIPTRSLKVLEPCSMQARAALAATPAAAPLALALALPEPAMNEEGYLPCPFCGSDQVSLSTGEMSGGQPWHYVECESCTATAEPEKWNERALLATGGQAQAVEQAPILYVSKGQLDNHSDPGGPDSANAGRYLPCRITPAGKFTTPLFAAPQAQAVARDAERLAFVLSEIRRDGMDALSAALHDLDGFPLDHQASVEAIDRAAIAAAKPHEEPAA